MATRILRDGILTSESVDALGFAEEVFYRRLQSVVDDHGRFYGNPKLLRAACYPLRLDRVTDADVSLWLAACVAAALVQVYTAADGKRYLEVVKFGQRLQSKSKFPDPVCSASTVDHGDSPWVTVENRLVGVEVGVVCEVGVEEERAAEKPAAPPPAKRPRGKPPTTAIPDDFAPSDRVRAWAARKGYGDLERHLEAFVSKCRAKAYRYADWDEALMGAVRDDWAQLRSGRNARAGPNAAPSKHLQGVASILGVNAHDLTDDQPRSVVREDDRGVLGGPVPAEPRRLSGG